MTLTTTCQCFPALGAMFWCSFPCSSSYFPRWKLSKTQIQGASSSNANLYIPYLKHPLETKNTHITIERKGCVWFELQYHLNNKTTGIELQTNERIRNKKPRQRQPPFGFIKTALGRNESMGPQNPDRAKIALLKSMRESFLAPWRVQGESQKPVLVSRVILFMAEILHQLIAGLPLYLQDFIHPWWCRISSINSISTYRGEITPFIRGPSCVNFLLVFWFKLLGGGGGSSTCQAYRSEDGNP